MKKQRGEATQAFLDRFQVTPANFKGKRSNAKNILLCARKCNKQNINYRVLVSGGELWFTEYRDDGVKFTGYFPLSETLELRKLAKNYHTFKLENISTEALKVLAEATK